MVRRAPQFADEFVESKAQVASRSLNKRGARDIHRYRGDGFTHVTYERGSSRTSDWLLVSVLVEAVDDRSCNVVVTVGGGGEGAFKLEEVTPTRLFGDEASFGASGRLLSVLKDVKRVCESLDLEVETEWQTESESETTVKLERKLFGE